MTVSFHTLGCKTNAYETQAIREQFRESGFETGEFTEPCDIYVINTCAVTSEASRKSRQIVKRCKRLNPQAIVVVTGCYAQEAGMDLMRQTDADIIVGNGEKGKIVSLVEKKLSESDAGPSENWVLIEDQTHFNLYENQKITGQEDHIRAYVKIQDGCDRFCSYCIIPFLRGRSRSRSVQEILSEVKGLSEKGFPEIVLTGIDISSFEIPGISSDENSLFELIRDISDFEGIRRIRLGSLEAGIVSESLIRRLKGISKFCPQFHLSLQSGSDSVLKRMNRHYTTREFSQSLEMIRSSFPDAAITTDIIVGFPGESEEEFEQTLEFVRREAFSRLHVFPYSRRPGTRADKMPDHLSRNEKERRARRLIDLGEEMRLSYESRFIGKTVPVLIEEGSVHGRVLSLEGYTKEYVRIRINLTFDQAGRAVPEDFGNRFAGRIMDAVPGYVHEGMLCCDKTMLLQQFPF